MKNKHLLKLLDLSREEIYEILDLADQLKYNQKHGIAHDVLKGKTVIRPGMKLSIPRP